MVFTSSPPVAIACYKHIYLVIFGMLCQSRRVSYITSDQSAENSIQGYRFAAEVMKVNNESLVDIVTYANFGYGNKTFDKLKDKKMFPKGFRVVTVCIETCTIWTSSLHI